MKTIARVEFAHEKAKAWAAELRQNQSHLFRSVRVYQRVLNVAGASAAIWVIVTEAR
jgi:hypothetical protein